MGAQPRRESLRLLPLRHEETWMKELMFIAGICGLAAAAAGQDASATLPPQHNQASAGASLNTLLREQPRQYQSVIAASQLAAIPHGARLMGLTWRRSIASTQPDWPPAPASWSYYEIILSRSANPPGSFSPNFQHNFVENDAVVVRTGSMALEPGSFPGGPAGALASHRDFGTVIPFTTPYTYTGGDLLTTIYHGGHDLASFMYLDSSDANAPGYGTLYRAHYATSLLATTGTPGPYTVMRFDYRPAAVIPPEYSIYRGSGWRRDVYAEHPCTYQLLMSPEALRHIPAGARINGLSFRVYWMDHWLPGSRAWSQYDVIMSRSNFEVGSSSPTFEANIGNDALLVRSGPLTLTETSHPTQIDPDRRPFGHVIQFDQPYEYKGGTLAITIRHSGSGLPGPRMDAVAITAIPYITQVEARMAESLTSPQGERYSFTIPQLLLDSGLVVPNTTTNTIGNVQFTVPMHAYPRIFQIGISASELTGIPIGSIIDGMAWRPSGTQTGPAWPTTDTTFPSYTIEIAPAARSPENFSRTFAENIGPGAVTVQDGPLMVPADAYHERVVGTRGRFAPLIRFQTPFVYTGGDLVITVRHQGLGALLLTTAVDAFIRLDPPHTVRGVSADNPAALSGSYTSVPVTYFTWHPPAPPPPPPCYANCDASIVAPVLNVEDFTCFINAFSNAQSLTPSQQAQHYANCDQSTTAPVLNVEDFTCFINRFAQGCP
jgi:hypothetical protein